MENRFTLRNGVKVWINQLNISTTFLGINAFSRTRENNEWLFNKLNYPSTWGDINSCKIPPKKEELNGHLNNYFYSLYLESDFNLKPDADGSHMVVMFTEKKLFLDEMHQAIQSKLNDLDWISLAQSYYF